jgi:phosphate transport system protein
MTTPHIIREFDQAIDRLRDSVLGMAGQAQLNLERAMEALLTRNIDLSKVVIADDNDVDDFEQQIDSLGMDILLRFHPVASDLRLVITSMKVSANLERISDHAVNIAKRAKKIGKRPELAETQLLEPIYTLALQALRRAMQAYTDRNSELGLALDQQDKELDRIQKRVISSLSGLLEEGGERSEDYLHLIFVARSLERIGDLAVNIGEDAVFLDLARDIRHDKRLAADLAAEQAAKSNNKG